MLLGIEKQRLVMKDSPVVVGLALISATMREHQNAVGHQRRPANPYGLSG
jgi:hypothetical protein